MVFDEPYPAERNTKSKRAADSVKVIAERDVEIPMRDGVILRANVFRPDRGGPFPVLVMRTPYGKPNGGMDRYVKAGYIVVTQDARGRYASDGKWESFVRFETHDAEDGYDTVEWAAKKLAGSNGRVGTFGASYNAFLQWRLAALQPHLARRDGGIKHSGALHRPRRARHHPSRAPHALVGHQHGAEHATSFGPSGSHNSKAEMRRLWTAGDSKKWLHHLPWLQLPREACEDETEAVRYWLRNPHTDPWKLHEDVKKIRVPNLNFIGWCDHCNGNMLLDRTIMSEAATPIARNGSRTVVGPWAHSKNRRYGNIDFGPEASVDVTEQQIRWFDYWLKKKQNGVDKDFAVEDFRHGRQHVAQRINEWPLKRTQNRSLFISSHGTANTPAGRRPVALATAVRIRNGSVHLRS